MIRNTPVISDEELESIITLNIIKAKEKHIDLISRIQHVFRLKLSQKILKKKKEGMNMTVIKINDNLFTLIIRGNSRYFFIEHLHKKYPKILLRDIDFNNLSFIHKLR